MNELVRHFSTADIIRCARSHKGSRIVYTEAVTVPGRPKIKRLSKYVFCGECNRSIKDRKWCDGCGRPDGYVSRHKPATWLYMGVNVGLVLGAFMQAFR